MSAVDYASNPQALNDKLAQHNDKWVQQEERNKKQEIQIAELLGKTLYLARDKGFILSKALLDHIEAAATGHPIQGESKNLALADTFSRNDGNIREVIMDAVHDCPGLENLSAEEFLQHALQTTRLRNGEVPGHVTAVLSPVSCLASFHLRQAFGVLCRRCTRACC